MSKAYYERFFILNHNNVKSICDKHCLNILTPDKIIYMLILSDNILFKIKTVRFRINFQDNCLIYEKRLFYTCTNSLSQKYSKIDLIDIVNMLNLANHKQLIRDGKLL